LEIDFICGIYFHPGIFRLNPSFWCLSTIAIAKTLVQSHLFSGFGVIFVFFFFISSLTVCGLFTGATVYLCTVSSISEEDKSFGVLVIELNGEDSV